MRRISRHQWPVLLHAKTRGLRAVVAIIFALALAISPVSAQVDSIAASESRAALRAVQQEYGKQPSWQARLQRLSLKDVEVELCAGDRARPETLESTAAQLRSAAPPQYPGAAFQRLASLLERRAGELVSIRPEEWTAECQRQAVAFPSNTAESLPAARKQLEFRMKELERRLRAARDRGEAWRAFLCWPECRQMMATDAGDAALVDRLEIRWRGAPTVWTAAEMVEASLAMQSYLRLLRAIDTHETPADHATVWNELGQLLASRSTPSPADMQRIAAIVNQRERLGQASALTASIRRDYSHPNIVLQASTAWVQRQLAYPIQERYDVNAVFGGARSVGRGVLKAEVTSRFLPSTNVGQMVLHLEGTSRAQTSATSQRVFVKSHATTRIDGEKRFTLDARGLSAQPAQVQAKTSIAYDSINSPGLRRRREEAVRQTYAKRAGIEREAAAATRREIAQRLDTAGSELVAQFNSTYQPLLRGWQFDRHNGTPEVRVQASPEVVRWECRLEAGLVFAAPTLPPAIEPTADVTLSLAASALEAQCLIALAGRQLSGEEIALKISELLGESPPTSQERHDFHIAFAERPCDVTLADGQIQARFYVSSFDSTDVQYPAMTVDVRYTVAERSGDLLLSRQGGVQVRPLADRGNEKPALGGRQQTLRVAVQRKLNKAFPSEIVWPAPTLSTDNEADKLRVQQAVAENGWLQIAFDKE